MRWTHIFLLVLSTSYAKEEETNEVTPRQPKINLDANLRRALLKALTELENEENEKQSHQNLSEDRIIEKASASALSFYASSTSEPPATKTTTLKPIVVIQKSNGLQHKPITTLENFSDEQILTSASSSFSSNKFSSNGPNFVSNEVKATTKLPKVESTTATTTTTTTEESEAKVEDVQFFSAPLVAAFTVHQDERGLPKSVEPIFRPSKVESTTTERIQHNQLRTQLALQEKQRALEAEILRLKQQQQQQNYLIRQQQILHQQQLQLQKQKILDEQVRILQHHSTTQRNQFDNTSRVRGNLVSFQPSISFTSNQYPSGVLPVNAQQLPVKSATDFRSSTPDTFDYQQFNYLSQQQPPFLDSASNFNVGQPQVTLTAPKHHRVFRQESTTGNFFSHGFNNDYQNYRNRDNIVQQQNSNSNRFFRSNIDLPRNFNRIQPPIVNQQLNNLLYSSGLIRDKQQEDLNIVSKVLSLNHYGGDYKFDSSNISEQRVPASSIKKV